MSILYFSFIFFLSYFFFYKKLFFFGFKESFILGHFFYICLPLLIIVYYENILIDNFDLYKSYSVQNIFKVYFASFISLISFVIGYKLTNKRIRLINFNENFNTIEIIFALILFSLAAFVHINHINPTVIIYLLISLLIYKSDFSLKIKIFFLTFLLILFQFWTSDFSGSRRDIIKLFIIFLFFLKKLINGKFFFLFLMIIFLLFSIIFVIINTYHRSGLELNLNISESSLISTYDFFPTMDNFIYILNNDEYLYGKSIFKIFFSWIPRDLWPSKPFDTNLLITQQYKNVFVGGSSQSVGLLGEFYWNFSWFGVIIFSFILGILAKSFDLFKLKKLTDVDLIILSSLSYLAFILWRGSITTTIIIYLKNIIPLIAILYIAKLIFRKKNYK